jgi:hypothetical protein
MSGISPVFRTGLLFVVTCLAAITIAEESYIDQPRDTVARLPEALAGISRIEYDFPVYDYPYNDLDGYTFPSMQQSLLLTQDLTQGIHYGLALYSFTPGDRFARSLSWSWGLMLSEFAMIYFPGGYSWLHEEWHRAVLKQYGIKSYNGVYDFKPLSNTISVSRVSDEDLITLKRDHPLDMVRLAAAGNESQIELVRSLGRELFFNRSDCSLDWLSLLSNTVQVRYLVFHALCRSGHQGDGKMGGA